MPVHKNRKIKPNIEFKTSGRYQYCQHTNEMIEKFCGFFYPSALKNVTFHYYIQQVSNNKFFLQLVGENERYVKVLLVSSKVHCNFIRSNNVQEKITKK